MPTFEYWHHHGAVSVPDLEAAIAWYDTVLGFKLERRIRIDAIPADVAFVRNGPLRMEIFQVQDAGALPAERRIPNQDLKTHGNKHISFATGDVHALADELRRRGADIVFVADFAWGSNVFLRDNTGNLIEFVQEKPETETRAHL
ncbi:VOC family protein [Nitrospirillum sp. BR 11163]|uniref:VOC family protein n=1 Tax=Nitrospirillum sp. BR 11163 TaxID=3104323 RepID=UPI002AFF9AC8|nr:VOC family protein [Nitrospirillum sp. BR 11163]MEA1673073.1 VOC family protein [Nitrospirillum sp. BR 11163]